MVLRKIYNRYSGEAWSSLVPVIKLIGNLILFPLMISMFDAAEVTLWLLILTTNSLIYLIDFGFSPTFIRLISYVNKQPSYFIHDKVRKEKVTYTRPEIISLLNLVYMVLGALVVITSLFISQLIFPPVLNELADKATIKSALPFLLASLGLVIYWTKNNVYLLAIKKIVILRKTEACVSFIGYLAIFAVILITRDFSATIICFFLMLLLNGIIISIVANRFMKSEGRKRLSDNRLLSAVFSTVWKSGVGVIFGFFMTQGLGLYVSQNFSVLEAGSVLLLLRLLQVASSIIKPLFYTQIPHLSELYSQEKMRDVLLISSARMKLTLSLQVLGYLTLFYLGNTALQILGSDLKMPSSYMFLFICAADFMVSLGSFLLQTQTLNNKVYWHFANSPPVFLMLLIIAINPNLSLLSIVMVPFLAILLWYLPFTMVCYFRFYRAELSRERN